MQGRRYHALKLENTIRVKPLFGEPNFRFALYIDEKGEEKIWHFKAKTEVGLL